MRKLLLLLTGLFLAILPTRAQTTIESVPLVEGKFYTIKSDNQTGNKFYLTVENGNLVGKASAPYAKNYYWKCTTTEVNGETLYRFQNVETDKYLAHKNVSTEPQDIIIKGKQVYNTQCLPLFFYDAERYFLVTDNNERTTKTWNQAKDPFIKGHSSDFYIEEVTFDNNYPFLLSEEPQGDDFSPKTYWYYLKLHQKYATYIEGQEYISLSLSNPTSYGSFWAFVKDQNGKLKVYNAATGTSKVLAAKQNPKTDGTSFPILIKKVKAGSAQLGIILQIKIRKQNSI